MLPKLFKYGLKMLENREVEHDAISDSDSGENMELENE